VEVNAGQTGDYWNKGHATEAIIAVRDLAFGKAGIAELVSLIHVGNEPSRRVSEKVGMQFSGEIVRDDRQYWIYSIKNQKK
jgi:RimJ/RimL family protein N-acetyltransferase